MALTVEGLTVPQGRLQADFFAPGELINYANVWLEKAKLLTALEEAQEAYVYWRGFETAAHQMMSEAASQSIDGEGSRAYSDKQIGLLLGEAAAYRTTFLGLTEESGALVEPPRRVPTTSVPIQVVW